MLRCREGGGQDTERLEREREKEDQLHLRFQCQLLFFSFFLADVSARVVHPWINPITRWIDLAL